MSHTNSVMSTKSNAGKEGVARILKQGKCVEILLRALGNDENILKFKGSELRFIFPRAYLVQIRD